MGSRCARAGKRRAGLAQASHTTTPTPTRGVWEMAHLSEGPTAHVTIVASHAARTEAALAEWEAL